MAKPLVIWNDEKTTRQKGDGQISDLSVLNEVAYELHPFGHCGSEIDVFPKWV